jgi:diketogulonate reductase-like aldo/keto reductase
MQVAETALGVGYRMLDNAAEYGNEDEVGKALHKVVDRCIAAPSR